MYRPKNWNAIKNQDITGRDNIHYCAGFEAGADAMLEGLRQSNEPDCEVFETTVKGIDGKESGPIRAYGKPFEGKLVFIPDE